MVTILHGEDTVESRNVLQRIKSSEKQAAVLEFGGSTLEDFIQLAEGLDFFSNKKLIIVEIYKPNAIREIPYLSYLVDKPETTGVVIWAAFEVPENSILMKSAHDNGWKIQVYNGFNRSNVFNFIDSLFQKDRTAALTGLSSILDSSENLFGIISLIVSRVRSLLWVKSGVSSLKSLKPYLRRKVERQSKLYSHEELLSIFKECGLVDLETKKGTMEPVFGILRLASLIC